MVGVNVAHPLLADVPSFFETTYRTWAIPDRATRLVSTRGSTGGVFRPGPSREHALHRAALSVGNELRLEGEAMFPSEQQAAEPLDPFQDALVLFRFFIMGQWQRELRRM